MPKVADDGQLVCWGHSALTLAVIAPPEAPPCLAHLSGSDLAAHPIPDVAGRRQPIAEVLVAGEGREWSGTRSVASAVGARLRYTGHAERAVGPWRHLRIDTVDPATGLRVEVEFRTVDGLAAVQTWTRVVNAGDRPTELHAVSSFVAAGFLGETDTVDQFDLCSARSDWLAESRWTIEPVRAAGLPDLDRAVHGSRSRGCIAVASRGAWSTCGALPTAVLVHHPTGRAWGWQIEHNGGWRWEIGEGVDGIYVAANGPTDSDHQWRHVLEPGRDFVSVPVGVVVSDHGLDGAAAALTAYRRRIVRAHPDRTALPVVFNDYMNTLMGDPTSDALVPLVDAAGKAGADYFCIDAGWYADPDVDHWSHAIGAWEPSETRFPAGLAAVIDRIRAAGMVPGLWMEPEVVGVNSPLAKELPDEAFFLRDGRRQVEDGRYHLDLRHPAARAHLDDAVDRLVGELGVGYFKFDYNIDPGPGTEVKAAAPGDGLLGHNRAHLAWLDGLLDRHPGLVIENCASGAMRMDYGILARVQLQSTSDQQNPLRYPPIAAAAPMSVLPEQSASWAYPQPEMSAEEIAFCMVTGMMGRLYLSGHLDAMSPAQLRLVADGLATHKRIRTDLARAVPVWPLGLPGWTDPWVALGFHPQGGTDGVTLLAVWRRPGASAGVSCTLPHLAGRPTEPEVIYPTALDPWTIGWDRRSGALAITASGSAPAARLFRFGPVR